MNSPTQWFSNFIISEYGQQNFFLIVAQLTLMYRDEKPLIDEIIL